MCPSLRNATEPREHARSVDANQYEDSSERARTRRKARPTTRDGAGVEDVEHGAPTVFSDRSHCHTAADRCHCHCHTAAAQLQGRGCGEKLVSFTLGVRTRIQAYVERIKAGSVEEVEEEEQPQTKKRKNQTLEGYERLQAERNATQARLNRQLENLATTDVAGAEPPRSPLSWALRVPAMGTRANPVQRPAVQQLTRRSCPGEHPQQVAEKEVAAAAEEEARQLRGFWLGQVNSEHEVRDHCHCCCCVLRTCDVVMWW